METFKPTRNVLVAVDVQNDFVTGSLAVSGGEEVVAPINALARAARKSGDTTVYTRDWHPETTPHFETWPVHCVAGTEGAEFHPDLNQVDGDIILDKGTEQTDGYSGVEGIDADGNTLESLITPEHPDQKINVFIGGLATDYCVKATAIDIAAGFKDDERVKTYLIRDAVRAVNLQPDDEQQALAAIEEAGVLAMTSQEILAAFYNLEV